MLQTVTVAGFLSSPWGVAEQKDEDAAENHAKGKGFFDGSQSPDGNWGGGMRPSAGILAKIQICGTNP